MRPPRRSFGWVSLGDFAALDKKADTGYSAAVERNPIALFGEMNVGTEVYRLSRNGEDLDRWVLIHNSTGKVFEKYFGNEAVALVASDLYDKLNRGYIEGDITTWPMLISNAIANEIDKEIGFDRKKHCPEQKMYHGNCEGCPFLDREDDQDKGIERWMCLRRRDEVRAAEKLMHGGAGG